MGRYAAIDQGTTSTRLVVLDESGHSQFVNGIEHKQILSNPGWVEHDGMELLNNIRQVLEQAGEIDAIGIANQGETVIAWNAETGQPIYNAIVWQDTRTQPFIDQLKANGAEERVTDLSGLPLSTYFSAGKLNWIINNVPEARTLLTKGLLRLGTTDSFFLDHLCGSYVTDFNTASRTSLMNLKTGQWDSELCEIFGIPMEALPRITHTIGEFGSCNINGKNIPVTASLVDQFAGTYGHGCRSAGDAKFTFGTGAFGQLLTGNSIPSGELHGLLPVLAWKFPDENFMYGLDGGVNNSASAINWARRLGLFNDFNEINQFSGPKAIERDVIFVPSLSGLACPYWDHTATGNWHGLTLDVDKSVMMQSILEGVAFRAAQVVEAMNSVSPVGDRISIDGGLSVNNYFRQCFADILQKEVVTSDNQELSAYGTALLARKGLGITSEINRQNHIETITYPNAVDSSAWKERFAHAIKKSQLAA